MSGTDAQKKISKTTFKKRQGKKETLMKDSVTAFLCDPFKTGAYCSRVYIPYAAVIELWKFLSEKGKERHKKLKVAKPEEDLDYFRFMRDEIEEYPERILDDMLNFLTKLDDICPEEVVKWSNYGNLVIYPDYFAPSEEKEEGYFFFPPQAYFVDIEDAISIRIDKKANPNIVAEVSSLTPKSLFIFRSFLSSIPCIKTRFTYVDEGKRHSRRFVFDLYPSVAALWVDELAAKNVSRDITDFLGGAIDYLDKREWQMSIILSAISVEVLLADIYEEILHKEAPPAPIGFLIKEIDKKRKFPPEAMRPLKVVNRMRKAAVHRGITSFTKKDAILGLMDATKFVLWCSFQGKSFCNIETIEQSENTNKSKN